MVINQAVLCATQRQNAGYTTKRCCLYGARRGRTRSKKRKERGKNKHKFAKARRVFDVLLKEETAVESRDEERDEEEQEKVGCDATTSVKSGTSARGVSRPVWPGCRRPLRVRAANAGQEPSTVAPVVGRLDSSAIASCAA